MATRDRLHRLGATLAHLSGLPERPPVIVVDNGSADGTPDAVERDWPGIQVIRLGRNAGAAARTAGVLAARTPYVAFSDDDSWWAPDALQRAAEAFDDAPRLGLIAAGIWVQPGDRDDPACAPMAAGPPSAIVPGGRDVLGFVACGAVVRRGAYLDAGGFHRRFGIGGEEELLAMDLTVRGWRCVYCPWVIAHHHPDGSDGRPGRRSREVRNALWTAWLRRRPPGALRRTRDVLAAGALDPATWTGAVEAVAGLPWVLAERAPVDDATEAWRAALDAGSAHAPVPRLGPVADSVRA